MSDYEVRVTPTIDIDMEQLKGDVRNLSNIINKESTGKLRLELDGRDVKKQAQHIIAGITKSIDDVQIGVRLDPGSIKNVEKEIRDSLIRISELSDRVGDIEEIGDARSVSHFRQHVQMLTEMGVEYERLTKIQENFGDTFTRQQKSLLGSSDGLENFLGDQLKRLNDVRVANEEIVNDTLNDFKRLHKATLELPPMEALINFDEAQIASMLQQKFNNISTLTAGSPVNIDVGVNIAEDSLRQVEATIADIKTQLKQITEVVIPSISSRDMDSLGVQLARELGHDANNLDEARFSQDIIAAYTKRLNLIQQAVNASQQLNGVSADAVNENQELLQSLASVVGQLETQMLRVTNQIEHHQAVLANLGVVVHPQADISATHEALNVIRDIINDTTLAARIEIKTDDVVQQVRSLADAFNVIHQSIQTPAVASTQQNDIAIAQDIELLKGKEAALQSLVQLLAQYDGLSNIGLTNNEVLVLNEDNVNRALEFIRIRLQELQHSFTMPLTASVDDVNTQNTVREIMNAAQLKASANPVNLPVDINLDAAVDEIVRRGIEAKQKLEAMGAERFARTELRDMHPGLNDADFNTIVEQYKTQSAFSEKLTKNLREEKETRRELERVIEQANRVQAGEFHGVSSEALHEIGIIPREFSEYIRYIESLRHEAQAAQEELNAMATGMRQYAMEFTDVITERIPVGAAPTKLGDAPQRFEEQRREQVKTMTAYAQSIQELEERWFGAIQGRHDYDPSAVTVNEVAITQEHIERLATTVMQYNNVLKLAGENAVHAFGTIDIPSIELTAVANFEQAQQTVVATIDDIQTAINTQPIEITFGQISEKIDEWYRLHQQVQAVKDDIFIMEGLPSTIANLESRLPTTLDSMDAEQLARYDDVVQKLTNAKRMMNEMLQSADIPESLGTERFSVYMERKRGAIEEFDTAITNLQESIFTLGQGSGDVAASIDFIKETMARTSQNTASFISSQRKAATEIAEDLRAVAEAYKNFVIPDPNANRGTRAWQAAVDDNLLRKSTGGRWAQADDETIGKNVLRRLEEQKQLLERARVLAEQYHDALGGGQGQLGKPVKAFLSSLEQELERNIASADKLRASLKIEDPVASQMSRHIGQQIQELRNVKLPEDYRESIEASIQSKTKLIALAEQYEAVLTRLHGTGHLKDNEVPRPLLLQRELESLQSDLKDLDAHRTTVTIEADTSKLTSIVSTVHNKVNAADPITIPTEAAVPIVPTPDDLTQVTLETTATIPDSLPDDLIQLQGILSALDSASQTMVNNFIRRLSDAGSEIHSLKLALERLSQLQSGDFTNLDEVMHWNNKASLGMLHEFTGMSTNNKNAIKQALESINPERYAAHIKAINDAKEDEHQRLLSENQRRQSELAQASQGFIGQTFNVDEAVGRMGLGKFTAALEREFDDALIGLQRINENFIAEKPQRYDSKPIQDYIAYLNELKQAYENAQQALQNPVESAINERQTESLFNLGGTDLSTELNEQELEDFIQRNQAIITGYIQFVQAAGGEANQALQQLGDGLPDTKDIHISTKVVPPDVGDLEQLTLETALIINDESLTGAKAIINDAMGLQVNNDGIRESFTELNRLIEVNKSISQENLEQKQGSVTAIQDSLQKLIGMYETVREAAGDLGLSDVDTTALASLREQLATTKTELSALQRVASVANVEVAAIMDEDTVRASVEQLRDKLATFEQLKVTASFDSDGDEVTHWQQIQNIVADLIQLKGQLGDTPISLGDIEANNLASLDQWKQNILHRLQELQGKIDDAPIAIPVTKEAFDSTPDHGVAQDIKTENAVVRESSDAWRSHAEAIQGAIDAERIKASISSDVAARLDREATAASATGEAFESLSDAKRAVADTQVSGLGVDISGLDFGAGDANNIKEQLENIFSAAIREIEGQPVAINITSNADEVSKAVITYQDNIGRTIKETFGLVKSEGERVFAHLQTQMAYKHDPSGMFDAEAHQRLAMEQITTLQNKSRSLLDTFDTTGKLQEQFQELGRVVGEINDPTSLAKFNSGLKVQQEIIRGMKADLQGLNRLDPASAAQRQIEGGGYDARISGLRTGLQDLDRAGIRELDELAQRYADLESAIDSATSQLGEFKSAKNTMTPDATITAFNSLVMAINQAESQLKGLNNEKVSHAKTVTDYIATLRLLGQTQRLANRTDPSNRARLSELQAQEQVLQNKIGAYERLQFAEQELARITIARTRANNDASGRVGTTVTPLSDADIQRKQLAVDELQRTFAGLNFGLNTDASEDALNRVRANINDAVTALEALRDNNGLEDQARFAGEFNDKLQLAKQTLRTLRSEEGDIRGFTRLYEQTTQLQGRLDKMGVNWSAFKADPNLAATWQTLREEVNRVREALQTAEAAGNTNHYAALNKEFQALSQRVRSFTTEVQGAGRAKMSFGDTIMATGKKLSAYLVSMLGFGRLVNTFRGALRYILEIDRAMTALRRVTDETARTYTNFLTDAYARAQRLNVSVNQIINATADFARLGYSIADATALGDAAAIYFTVGNVGTERLPMEDAVQSIISTMKAFNIEAQNAMHIVDAFNEVGNNFAISSRGIGEALFRSSAALSAANNTFEESIGMIVAANEVIQNPEIVGTALRTLSMRLRNSAGELQDMGEYADGAAESVTRLHQQLLEITDGRVDIMATATDFKSTFEILSDLSAIWGTLTDVQQAEVTRLVAGVRQGQVMAALMEGMSSAAGAATTALYSYGSAMRENIVWQQSLEGRMAAFQTAFEATVSSMVSSRWVGWFYSAGTAVARFLGTWNGLVGQLILFPPVMGAVISLVRQLAATKVASGIIDSFRNWGTAIASLPANLSTYGAALIQVSSLQTSGKLTVESLTAATKSLSGAQAAHIAVMQKDVIAQMAVNKAKKAGKATDLAYIQAQIKKRLALMGVTGAKLESATAEITRNAATKAGITANAGFIASLKTKAVSLKAVGIAAKTMAAALIKNPITWIAIAVAGLMAFTNAQRAAEERAREHAQLTRERAREEREHYHTIGQLIERYRELRTAMTFDESARTEARNIQEQITDLVGGQARNLDLVNGGLAYQLSQLREIERRQAVIARDAAETAMMLARSEARNTEVTFQDMRMGPSVPVFNAFLAAGRQGIENMFTEIQSIGVAYAGISHLFEGLDLEGQIETLNELARIFRELERVDSNSNRATTALGEVESELRRLEALAQAIRASSGEFVELAMAASINVESLSRRQIDFFKTVFENSSISGDDLTDFFDGLANNPQLIDAIDHLFDTSHAQQSAQNYRNTILGLINSLPDWIRQSIDSNMDNEVIALRLGFYITDERIEGMKDEIRRVLIASEHALINELNINELLLARDIALNIHADDSVDWDYLNARMIMLRRSFEGTTISAEDFSTAISNISSRMASLRSMENEMATTGGLSSGTVSSLMDELGENYLDYLYVVGNQIRLNTDAYRDFILVQQQSNFDRVRNARNELQELLELQQSQRPTIDPIYHLSAGMDTTVRQQMLDDYTAAIQRWETQLESTQGEIERLDQQLQLKEATLLTVKGETFNYIETLNRMDTALSVSQAALSEMNSQGYISWETFIRLSEAMPNIADHITTANGQLVLNTESWNANAVATELALKAFREFSDSLPPWNERTQGQIQIMHYLHDQYVRLRDGVLTANEIMEQAVEATNQLASAYSLLTGAIDEFNEHGNLTIGTVQRLLEAGDEYLDLLEFSEGRLILNIAAIDKKTEALREEMIASQQAALAEEIRAIIQEDTRRKTDELSASTDHARTRLINIGQQALTTAENFGVLAAAVNVANQMMIGGEYGDLSHLSEQAMRDIEEAFRRTQRNIDIINSMAPATTGGASNHFQRGSAPSRSSTQQANRGSSSGGDPWLDEANRQIAELRWLHDMQLISEETFLNRLDGLNQRFFANRAQYLDEWRRLELEVVNGVRRHWEQGVQLQLTRAREFMNFDDQIDLYRQLQNDLHEQANRMRRLGFDDSSNEIMELRNQWQDLQNSIFDATRERLEFRLSIAVENNDFDAQLEIFRDFQQVILEEQRRFAYMGAAEDSYRMQQLEQQYRAYAARIVDVFNDKFRQERDAFDRHFSHLEFRISITSDTDHATHERLLNDQLENRLSLSRSLIDQMVRLRMQTDATTQSTQAWRDLMQDLQDQYQANVRGIYQLVEAHRSLAESQISDVRNLQNQVIAMLRARHQRERDLEREAHDARVAHLDAERDRIRAHFQMQIDYIDDLLRALQRQWAEEDRRRRQQDEINDLDELRRRMNELRIAA